MKYVYLTLNWVFGVLFLLTGFLSLIDSPLGGACLIAVGLLLLPPVRLFANSKTNVKIPLKVRSIMIFVLFAIFGMFADKANKEQERQSAAEQAQERKQKNIDVFTKKRSDILLQAKMSLDESNYQAVISQTSKYLVSGDVELAEINGKAKAALAAKQKAEKTESLLAKLKSVPASEFQQNKDLYRQLLEMHPENQKYKDKISHYSTKLKKESQAKAVADARKQQIERQFSAWDGSHRNLERLIKQGMNDPDSYEHDETVYRDMGDHLIVKTTYRGKNAFGGVVRNFIKVKVGLDGDILQVIDQT